jgi:hypothetical protein
LANKVTEAISDIGIEPETVIVKIEAEDEDEDDLLRNDNNTLYYSRDLHMYDFC